jgi:hypothetical protein
MDVAGFVGVASSGPIDVPVPVEDVLHFRRIFGEDPAVGWDAARGCYAHGLLGPAVEAFFQNGGRRCVVVRAAGGLGPAPGDPAQSGDPWTHVFPVPGLAPTSGAAETIRVRARAPGSWARALAVSTTLERRPLGGAHLALTGPSQAPALTVQLEAPAGAVGLADLVELEAREAGLLAWLEVASVTVLRRGLLLTSTPGGFWVSPAPGQSPPGGDPDDRSPPMKLLSSADAVAAVGALSTAAVRARVVTFELAVSQEGRALQRMTDLALSPRHPRFWGSLPDDVELFAAAPLPRSDGRDAEAAALRGEAAGDLPGSAAGRFSLAGPISFLASGPAAVALPSGMDLVGRLDRAEPALAAPDDLAAQDGLGSLGGVALVDDRLGGLMGGALLETARSLDDAWREWLSRPDRRPPRRLRGLHALLPVDEVTLMAVPDAALPAWSAAPGILPELLGAPTLDLVTGPDVLGRLTISWAEVDGADGYRLEWDEAPDFTAPAIVLDGLPDPAAEVLPDLESGRLGISFSPPASCARRLFFRLRAGRGGEPSPWSQVRSFQASVFAPCSQDDAPEVILTFTSDPAVLSWAPAPGEVLAADAIFRLEQATDPLFESARTVVLGAATSYLSTEPVAGAAYYRARAERPLALGPWSATAVLPPRGGRPTVEPPSPDPTDAPVLLTVQVALLRLASAAGDRLALLGLPRHFRVPEAAAYLSALLPDETAPQTGRPRVELERSLTAGEESSLSFGAVLHPWLARLATREAGKDAVDFAPPEGAVAGLLAQTARGPGAWCSSANQPLAGVLGLEPVLDDDGARALADLQIDPVVAAPQGFVMGLDDTLSREDDTRPLTVRRLLTLLRRLALREGTVDVFEPQSLEFVERVRLRFGRLLADLFHRGAFRGRTADEAYAVVADDSVNPRQSLDLGRFVVELRVAPSRPLRFLRVQLLQTAPEQVALTSP